MGFIGNGFDFPMNKYYKDWTLLHTLLRSYPKYRNIYTGYILFWLSETFRYGYVVR